MSALRMLSGWLFFERYVRAEACTDNHVNVRTSARRSDLFSGQAVGGVKLMD